MSVLIGYASKHGASRAYAEAMAKELGPGARAMDLDSREAASADLGAFKRIILGSSVYAGSARPAFRKFLARRSVELGGKELSFFLCGLAKGEDTKGAIDKSIPEAFRRGSARTAYLPGWLDSGKLTGFERFIMGMIEKAKAKEGAPAEKPARPDVAAEARNYLKVIGAI